MINGALNFTLFTNSHFNEPFPFEVEDLDLPGLAMKIEKNSLKESALLDVVLSNPQVEDEEDDCYCDYIFRFTSKQGVSYSQLHTIIETITHHLDLNRMDDHIMNINIDYAHDIITIIWRMFS